MDENLRFHDWGHAAAVILRAACALLRALRAVLRSGRSAIFAIYSQNEPRNIPTDYPAWG